MRRYRILQGNDDGYTVDKCMTLSRALDKLIRLKADGQNLFLIDDKMMHVIYTSIKGFRYWDVINETGADYAVMINDKWFYSTNE